MSVISFAWFTRQLAYRDLTCDHRDVTCDHRALTCDHRLNNFIVKKVLEHRHMHLLTFELLTFPV